MSLRKLFLLFHLLFCLLPGMWVLNVTDILRTGEKKYNKLLYQPQVFSSVRFTCSVQFSCSVVSDSLRPHESQHTRPPSITISWSSLKLTSIESVMPSSHLILCRPLFLLPPIPPSIRVFSNESTLCMRWPKYWSFSLSIIPSKEHPRLISFRMD